MDEPMTDARSEEGPREVAVPHDLRIALHNDPAAEAAFAGLPFSHQREYVDWILEAAAQIPGRGGSRRP